MPLSGLDLSSGARAGLTALDSAPFRDRLLRMLYKNAQAPAHS